MITLRPATAREASYGITHVSEASYAFSGRVHNSNSQHLLQRWDNTCRPTPDGRYVDPHGTVTVDAVSWLWSAQATILADTPVDRPVRAGWLAVGDTVDVAGFGTFTIGARSLHDPHMVQVPA